MAIIRPRHGIKSLWDTYKNRIYAKGEILVESPESGVGTGHVNVKFGDGVTDYENLPYAIEAPISECIENSEKPLTSGAGYELLQIVNTNYLPLIGGTMGGEIHSCSILPKTKDTYGLGNMDKPYTNVMSKWFNIVKNGTQYASSGVATEGTTDVSGIGILTVGNATPSGTEGNAKGFVRLYGEGSAYTQLTSGNNGTVNNGLILPATGGTLALTSDLTSALANYLPKTGGAVAGKITSESFVTDSTKSIAPSNASYNTAQFVANADHNTDDTKRAGYGFHNVGKNGAFLYLDTDGTLKLISSSGTTHTLARLTDTVAVANKLSATGHSLLNHKYLLLGDSATSSYIRSGSRGNPDNYGITFGNPYGEVLYLEDDGSGTKTTALYPALDNKTSLGYASIDIKIFIRRPVFLLPQIETRK